MEKQGGIYARYSSGRDRDQTSTIDAQVAMCREKAQREGIVIDDTHIYVDRGISGPTIQRAGFQGMLAAIESGDFSEILYAKDDKRLF
jgi:DNA invertase Pin-like site-specific DNA recombinase